MGGNVYLLVNPNNMKKKVDNSSIKVRIEHMSFESNGKYLDVEVHTDYVEISVGGIENEKIALTLQDWKIIDTEVRKVLQQE